MERTKQTVETILEQLSPIEADWKNGFAEKVEQELQYMSTYITDLVVNEDVIAHLLDRDFDAYSTIFQLCLGLSKDEYKAAIATIPGGGGIISYKKLRKDYLAFLLNQLHLREAIDSFYYREWSWVDILLERLRSGRGSAIKGQRRGRFLEDMIADVIREVFGNSFVRGCNFTGLSGEKAKAEFAIPSAEDPKIIFEAKAYGATGSKQTDVTGDIEKICAVKLPATEFLFVTDGMTWKYRQSDLKKIVARQNAGYIRKIYTSSMMNELKEDLLILKSELKIGPPAAPAPAPEAEHGNHPPS